MAKRELRRKVLATIITVFVMCCGLALCIVLLITSKVFSSTIRWLMLACTVGLGIATIGLLVCKIQEIRTLSKLVKKEAELPQQPWTNFFLLWKSSPLHLPLQRRTNRRCRLCNRLFLLWRRLNLYIPFLLRNKCLKRNPRLRSSIIGNPSTSGR